MHMFKLSAAALVAAIVLAPAPARAHFLWLAASEDGRKLQLFFSEAAEPDDPKLLKYAEKAVVRRVELSGATTRVAMMKGKDSFVANLKPGTLRNSVFVLNHDFGVLTRGKNTFLLRYYAKTGPILGSKTWAATRTGKHLEFELVPSKASAGMTVVALWKGKPAVGVEVKIAGPGFDAGEAKTDKQGRATFKATQPGLYSLRAKLEQEKAGEVAGKKYTSIRHYSTLAVRIPGTVKKPAKPATSAAKSPYPDIPVAVTSFGGAIAGGYLYMYGGHTGTAHSYSNKGQSNALTRLNLKRPSKWETVATGPRRQGLALVAYNGKLFRVGGFTAKNKAGEKHSLWSQADVAAFDPHTKKWTALPSLPEPRSSHDAAMIGSKLYVAGGWQLQGETKSKWHETAWVMDLAAKSPKWQALPIPPFERRALALAAHAGKLYVIGGMQRRGGPSTRVDVYDPQTKTWSQGPNMQGKPFEGFGCSAFATGGKLFVSTNQGNLQRLSDDGKSWRTVQKLERARFFHRMLPLDAHRLISVGGANMGVGKFTEVDVIHVK